MALGLLWASMLQLASEHKRMEGGCRTSGCALRRTLILPMSSLRCASSFSSVLASWASIWPEASGMAAAMAWWHGGQCSAVTATAAICVGGGGGGGGGGGRVLRSRLARIGSNHRTPGVVCSSARYLHSAWEAAGGGADGARGAVERRGPGGCPKRLGSLCCGL